MEPLLRDRVDQSVTRMRLFSGQRYRHGWIPIDATKDLDDAVASGTASRERLTGGANAATEIVTHNNGARSVSKRFNDLSDIIREDFTPTRQADAEQLVAALGGKIGAPVPPVVRTEPGAVHMAEVPGVTLLTRYADAEPGAANSTERERRRSKILDDLVATDAGLKLGVLDLLADNWDRKNPGNVMVDHGTPFGIDHALSFEDIGTPERPPSGRGRNPFTVHFVQPGANGRDEWGPNPLTQQDIAWLRARLDEVRSDFQTAGRDEWWRFASGRLDAIAQHATGKKSRFA